MIRISSVFFGVHQWSILSPHYFSIFLHPLILTRQPMASFCQPTGRRIGDVVAAPDRRRDNRLARPAELLENQEDQPTRWDRLGFVRRAGVIGERDRSRLALPRCPATAR